MTPQMDSIIASLRLMNRPQLSKVIEKWGNESLEGYGQLWWQGPKRPPPLERELIQAFKETWQQMGWADVLVKQLLEELEQKRLLQTAMHLTPTEGPTFLASHQLATLRQPQTSSYLVGAYSGVPFSNAAWSGAINYGTKTSLEQILHPSNPLFRQAQAAVVDRIRDGDHPRLSLIPSKWRDGLVDRSATPDRLNELFSDLLPGVRESSLRSIVPKNSYDNWALSFSEKLTRSVLNNHRIYFFNLNEVIRKYLIIVLKDDSHWLTQIFLNPWKIKSLEKELANNWFVAEVEKQGKKKVEQIHLQNRCFESKTISISAEPESIISALNEHRFCPGLTICFWILAFYNGIRCLGGFEQIEYLAELDSRFNQLEFQNLINYSSDQTALLTTGRCIDQDYEVYPIDVFLGNSKIPLPEGTLLSWLQPIILRLTPRLLRY
jgi:hypothetical protein